MQLPYGVGLEQVVSRRSSSESHDPGVVDDLLSSHQHKQTDADTTRGQVTLKGTIE
jgi:hypothetical protein